MSPSHLLAAIAANNASKEASPHSALKPGYSTLPGPISNKPAKPPKQDYSTVDLSPSSADQKPLKPPKAEGEASKSVRMELDPLKPLKPSKPPKVQTEMEEAPSPSSAAKPARPKRVVVDEDSSKERGSMTKSKPVEGGGEDERYSTCSSGRGSSLSKEPEPEPEQDPEAPPSEEDDEEENALVSDATHTNKYGVTVVAGKALKVLGVSTPSGAMSRPGTKSPMHTSRLNNLISENGGSSANVIHYTSKATTVFADYDFKNEEHQILSYIRQGKTSAVCAALLDCSVDQFCKLIPVVACAIAETPGWAIEVGETLVAAIKQRIATSAAINQAVHFLKSSRLLSYPWAYNNWLSGLQTSSYLLEVCEILATREVGYDFKVPEGKKLFHPFQAGFTISGWQVTKIFNSHAKPRLVVPTGRLEGDKAPNSPVSNQGPAGALMSGNPIIIKFGDDVRQDVAVVHIMCMMNNLWASANLTHEGCPVKSLAYGCLALSDSIGCIEFVPNATPLRLVSQAGRYSSTAINRMITTGAGSFVAAYILGVRDRHFDNILVSKSDGALFHIDFGRILGDQTTIDTGAFAITPDLKEVISSFGDDKWEVFVQLCLIAYKTIRDNNRLIISFTSMLMAPFQSQETVRNFIAQRLRLHLEDEIAMAKIRKKVATAPTRWKTKFKNVVHGIATGD